MDKSNFHLTVEELTVYATQRLVGFEQHRLGDGAMLTVSLRPATNGSGIS